MITSKCSEKDLIVETEKGKYTIPSGNDFSDYVKGTCIAQERCTELGAILAPFTEKSEFDAVMEAINSCEYQNIHANKWVGLLISRDNSTRVFTNGVKFDEKTHGALYQENPVGMPRHCPVAILDAFRTNKLQISLNRMCVPQKRPYICFEAKKTVKSDSITSHTVNINTSLLMAVCSIIFVAVVCMFGYMARQNKILKLKLQQNSNDV